MFIEANIRYNMTFSSIKCEELKKIGKNQCHGWTIGIGYLFIFPRTPSVSCGHICTRGGRQGENLLSSCWSRLIFIAFPGRKKSVDLRKRKRRREFARLD